MARGLAERRIPLLVGGSLDTKTNPKLVGPPALLELENQFQLRTGEMRPRNGFQLLPTPERALNAGDNLFVTRAGGIGTISAGGTAGADTNVRALRYGNGVSGREGWVGNIEADTSVSTPQRSYPNITAAVAGLPSGYGTGGVPMAVTDPDMAVAGGAQHAAWTDGITAAIFSDYRDAIDMRQLFTTLNLNPATAALRPPLVASTGGNWMSMFYSAGANNLSAISQNPVTQVTSSLSLAADLAALPWFDVKAIPNTNNFAVAYKANAGGIKCGIYNPSASTFTSVVATAGADASFCMGWLDDSLASGTMYLATAGSGSGVVVREMSAANMVVSGTRVIDATATSNIRNITGHLYAAAKYYVLWDVAGASTIFDGMKVAYWDGSAHALGFWGGPHSLYSRSVKFPDGKYRVLGCFASPVQAMYTLLLVDTLGASAPASIPVGVQCHVLAGEAAARRSQCSLTTPISIGSGITMAVARARSITTPDGNKAAQVKSLALIAFSQMDTITHAREMGGTVFLPGGIIYREDGANFDAATFPIYPEAATGSSSAGGSMTASGSYLYRVVYRKADAAGRVTRSAGSVPFAIALGAADSRVTLAVYGLSLVPSESLSQVVGEIYRRGPAASGAALYNKVGEVGVDVTGIGPSTVAFIDTMSDTAAASGEVAYFNGNVLENFNPPSHKLLEVNGNRVGIVSAEDTTEFWFSKEYKAGSGIGFNPLLKAAISGDGAGGMTALAAMDGNWILFKKTAIYVLSGDGPNDLGQGSFNQPRAVSRTLGTLNPASVVETPDGIMFQAHTGGMWLLDRGLNLTYVGAGVDALTDGQPMLISGAALATSAPTVRFVTTISNPRVTVLEWDYYHKRWYTQYLTTSDNGANGCVNSPLLGFCIILQDGRVLQESAVLSQDTFAGTVSIIPKISFPHLQLAGLAGYQRFWSLDFTLEALGACTISADAEYDFSGTATGTPRTIAVPGGTVQVQYNPPDGKAKCTSVRPVLTVTGSPTLTFRLTGAVATVGTKRGSTVTAVGRMT